MGFPGGSVVKNLPANQAGDTSSIPRSGRFPGEGDGNPLQYSCLENRWTEEPGGLRSMGSQSWTRLSDRAAEAAACYTLVHSSCYHGTLQPGQLINNRNFLLTALEAGSLRSMCPSGQVSVDSVSILYLNCLFPKGFNIH